MLVLLNTNFGNAHPHLNITSGEVVIHKPDSSVQCMKIMSLKKLYSTHINQRDGGTHNMWV